MEDAQRRNPQVDDGFFRATSSFLFYSFGRERAKKGDKGDEEARSLCFFLFFFRPSSEGDRSWNALKTCTERESRAADATSEQTRGETKSLVESRPKKSSFPFSRSFFAPLKKPLTKQAAPSPSGSPSSGSSGAPPRPPACPRPRETSERSSASPCSCRCTGSS